MAHAGFSVFFLLSLMAAAVALYRAAWGNLPRILRALEGAPQVQARAPEFRHRSCPTADVPRVAKRLRITFPENLAPVRRVRRAWPFEREDPMFG
jgi:hypothetical protein